MEIGTIFTIWVTMYGAGVVVGAVVGLVVHATLWQ